jgi:hypothetical protein
LVNQAEIESEFVTRSNTCLRLFRPHLDNLNTHHSITFEEVMNTPLMFAVYALLGLIAVPATRELLRTARERAARARLIPIRIDERKTRQSRDSMDR